MHGTDQKFIRNPLSTMPRYVMCNRAMPITVVLYYTFLTWPAKHSDGLGPNPLSGQQDGCAGDFWSDFRAKDAERDHAPSRMRYFSRQSAVLCSPNGYHTFAARPTELNRIDGGGGVYRGNATRYESDTMPHAAVKYPCPDDHHRDRYFSGTLHPTTSI